MNSLNVAQKLITFPFDNWGQRTGEGIGVLMIEDQGIIARMLTTGTLVQSGIGKARWVLPIGQRPKWPYNM